MCTLELARYLLETERARPRARQLVRRSAPEVLHGFVAVVESLGALTGCFLSVSGSTSTVAGCLDPVRRRTRPIALRPQDDVFRTRVRPALPIVQTSQRITGLRAPITTRGSSVAIVGRLQPRVGAFVAQCGHGVAVVSRALARRGASIVCTRVAAGSEVVVGSMLILVRAPLIAVACRLVVIRPGLVLITPRLVAIRRGVILITHLVAAQIRHPFPRLPFP
jgi:hypothetical protein